MGAISRFDLREIITNTNTTVFVESGTLHGDGIAHALQFPFQEIHSIEIIDDLAKQARARFQNNKNVTIHTGSSPDVLHNILPGINGNILFWLDAHFPGADSGHIKYSQVKDIEYSKNLPLEGEIKEISKRLDTHKDVVIMDDLWIYESGDFEWGDFDTHCKKSGHDITLDEIAKNKNLSFLYDTFGNSHKFIKNYHDQGYVAVLPN